MSSAASPVTRRVIVAAAIVAVLVALVYEVSQARKKPQGDDPSTAIPQLGAVKTYDYPGAVHTEDPVTYAETPPVGGPHNPAWEDCGVYTQPIHSENAVHSLEHGTVWITYDPSLSSTDVASLQSALGAVPSKKTILSPYPGLPTPVVVTVWNAQLDLKGTQDPRLQIFLKFYGDGHTSPEGSFASCAGGVHSYASASSP